MIRQSQPRRGWWRRTTSVGQWSTDMMDNIMGWRTQANRLVRRGFLPDHEGHWWRGATGILATPPIGTVTQRECPVAGCLWNSSRMEHLITHINGHSRPQRRALSEAALVSRGLTREHCCAMIRYNTEPHMPLDPHECKAAQDEVRGVTVNGHDDQTAIGACAPAEVKAAVAAEDVRHPALNISGGISTECPSCRTRCSRRERSHPRARSRTRAAHPYRSGTAPSR